MSSQDAPQTSRRAKPAGVRGEAAGSRTSGRRGHPCRPTALKSLIDQSAVKKKSPFQATFFTSGGLGRGGVSLGPAGFAGTASLVGGVAGVAVLSSLTRSSNA